MADQGVALPLAHADDVLIEDVPPLLPPHPALSPRGRGSDGPIEKMPQVMLLDQHVISLGDGLAGENPALDVGQLDAEHGRLQGVEPGVPADVLVMIARLHAVNTEAAQARRPLWIVGRHHAGVAIGAQNLGRIKAEAADRAQRARAVALIFGPKGLSGVLNDGQVVALGHVPERLHFRALAEKVHDQDRFRLGRDLVLHLERVEVVSRGVDIGEDGPSAQSADGSGRREKRKGRHDHFVVGSHAQSLQGQREGIGAGRASHGMAHPAITGGLLLEGRDFRSQDRLAGGDHAGHGRFKLFLKLLMLRVQIEERHGHRAHGPTPFSRSTSRRAVFPKKN